MTRSETRLTLEDTLPVADAKLSDDCSCSAALNCLKIEPIESVPTARQPRLQKSIRSSIVRVFPAVFVLLFKAQLSVWHLSPSWHLSWRPLVLSCQCVQPAYTEAMRQFSKGKLFKRNNGRWYLQDDHRVFQTREKRQTEDKCLCSVIYTNLAFPVHFLVVAHKLLSQMFFYILHIQPMEHIQPIQLGWIVSLSN